jgi:hypothetical protein
MGGELFSYTRPKIALANVAWRQSNVRAAECGCGKGNKNKKVCLETAQKTKTEGEKWIE